MSRQWAAAEAVAYGWGRVCDAIGPSAGGRFGDVAGLVPVAKLGRPDPGSDGPPTPRQDSSDEEE